MITVRALQGTDLEAQLDAVAALRIAVFREWPYLYEGTLVYESQYLANYRDNPDALLIGAFDGEKLIGASTSARMEDHAGEFAAPFAVTGIPLTDMLYGAESVLMPEYRGQGLGHRFIDLREDHARTLGRRMVAFCSVLRPDNHPRRPANARNNDAFWHGRGYAPMPGVVAEFSWTDVGEDYDSLKPLQFWSRTIEAVPAVQTVFGGGSGAARLPT